MSSGHLIVEASWKFPSEEVPPLPDAADMERRVKREEILHTGKLNLKIVKERMSLKMSLKGLRNFKKTRHKERSNLPSQSNPT